MERKLDLKPCVLWVGGDAFVQAVNVELNGSTSNLSLNIQVMNKSGFLLVKADYEIYFYDSADSKLQDEAYVISGEDLDVKPNDIGVGLKHDISNSFPSARRAEVKLIRANFSDGKSIDLEYENMEKYALPTIKADDLSLLKTVAGDDAMCLPAKLALNWRCVCGYFNGDESDLCSNCMRDQGQIFADYGSIDKIKETIERELMGDIDNSDDLLKELEMDIPEIEEPAPVEEIVEEVEVPKVQMDVDEEEIVEEPEISKIGLMTEIKTFFSSTSKLGIAMIFFAGIFMSTSIFMFMFRLR